MKIKVRIAEEKGVERVAMLYERLHDYLETHVLAAHTDFFRMGVRTALLDYACNMVRENGVGAVRLDVYGKNYSAIHLYESCGFLYVGLLIWD